jgi:hypothetical protein
MPCLQQEGICVTFSKVFDGGNLIEFEVNKPFNADVCYDMKTV